MTTSRRDFLRTGVAACALSLTSLPSWIFQSRDALGGPQTMGYEYIDKHDWKREAQQAGRRGGDEAQRESHIWYLEKGKIQYPVKNFRFNQSLMQFLAPGNVDMIGKAERVGSSEGQGGNASLLPALKVKEFNFSSQSEAV